jgi:hypothetical protein
MIFLLLMSLGADARDRPENREPWRVGDSFSAAIETEPCGPVLSAKDDIFVRITLQKRHVREFCPVIAGLAGIRPASRRTRDRFSV